MAGIEMCWAYNRQYGTRFLAAMPTNLFGPGDQYDLHNSHVIPALLSKMHKAKVSGAAEVEIWGSGSPRREFLYSDDAANACVFLMNLSDEKLKSIVTDENRPLILNIGSANNQPTPQIAHLVAYET